MPKQKISAKELISDIRAGATDDFLMRKYSLSEAGIQGLFKKLVAAKAITQAEVDQRASLYSEEVYEVIVEEVEEKKPVSSPPPQSNTSAISECPACGFSQASNFDECPGCGIVVSKHQRKKGKRIRPTPVGDAVEETPKASKAGKTDKTPKLWRAACAIGWALAMFYFLFFLPYETFQASTVGSGFFGAFIFGFLFTGVLGLLLAVVVWSILRGIYWATKAMKNEGPGARHA